MTTQAPVAAVPKIAVSSRASTGARQAATSSAATAANAMLVRMVAVPWFLGEGRGGLLVSTDETRVDTRALTSRLPP